MESRPRRGTVARQRALDPVTPGALRLKSADRNRRWRMESIPWIQSPDEALARGRQLHKPVLYDFSAAPM
ncbi:MAG TPA: hypothetical protein VFP58_08275 [Candidatus Eisenbacteria bacterium]|nr:hypothetical protein [Candidatus Eisenbacteria bacterium]